MAPVLVPSRCDVAVLYSGVAQVAFRLHAQTRQRHRGREPRPSKAYTVVYERTVAGLSFRYTPKHPMHST